MIPVSQPYTGEEECEAAAQVIRSRWLSTGKEARAFEQELAAMFQAHVVGVSSASMGLELALAALDVGPGDEVIVPAITFVATSNVVVHAGARAVFADIDPHTGLLNPESVASLLTPRTKAIIPVDLYGQRVDLAPYLALAQSHGRIAIIEDAAQSFGTPGVGSTDGVITVFSFYATKNVAMGEGGAVVTRDTALADRVRMLSQQGVTADAFSRYHGARNYDVAEIGYKGNLPDIMAAIGRVQLRREQTMRSRREWIARRYMAGISLRTIDWKRPTNYHLYPVFVEDRDRIRAELLQRDIGTGVHYECIPGLTAYRKLGYQPENTPHAMRFGAEEMTLPLYPGMSDGDVEHVIRSVCEVLGGALESSRA